MIGKIVGGFLWFCVGVLILGFLFGVTPSEIGDFLRTLFGGGLEVVKSLRPDSPG